MTSTQWAVYVTEEPSDNTHLENVLRRSAASPSTYGTFAPHNTAGLGATERVLALALLFHYVLCR
jgi:hypothetical protein